MIRRALWGLLALALVGCMDTTGLDDLNQFAADWVSQGQPASIKCTANGLPVPFGGNVPLGSVAQCSAYNAAGTHLSAEGFPATIWVVSDTAILSVNLTGLVTAKAAGTADVSARGPKGSQASFNIMVQ